uniref:Protein muscleblind n=1 Tax=Syphacia muris TaxID=451379 RepID=A0A0N5B1L5_9BILA
MAQIVVNSPSTLTGPYSNPAAPQYYSTSIAPAPIAGLQTSSSLPHLQQQPQPQPPNMSAINTIATSQAVINPIPTVQSATRLY